MNPAEDPNQWYGARADDNGAYAIDSIPAGNLIVEAAHLPTLSKRVQSASLPIAGGTVIQDLILLPLEAPQLEHGNLQGRVFRADGQTPVPEVLVYTTYGVTMTDTAGNYRLEGLPAGSLLVSVIDPVLWEEAKVETSIVASRTTTADLLLWGGRGTIKGTVLDADGQPAPGILIMGGPSLLYTDAAGQFAMNDIPVGPRLIEAFDQEHNVKASAGANLTRPGDEISVILVLPATGTITGLVYRADGTTPAANIKVIVFGPGVWKTYTDATGAYLVKNMPAGPYTVSAFLSDYSDGNIAQTKVVFNHEVRRADVVFRGRGSVKGIIYDDDGVTPLGAKVGLGEDIVKFGKLSPPENPSCLPSFEVNGVKVALPPCEDVPIGFEFKQRNRVINNDVSSGTFTFTNIFVGDVLVEAANYFSPDIVSAEATIPAPNATVAVTLSLQSTGVVTGVVYQPGGITPAGAGVIVTLVAPTVKDVAVATDAAGHFEFPLLPAGNFGISVVDHEHGLVSMVTSSLVGVGQSVEVPIRLLRRGSVSVTVTGSKGLVEGASVTLQNINLRGEQRQGVTGADGKVLFTGGDEISEGRFTVTAYDAVSGVKGTSCGEMLPIDADPEGLVAIEVVLRDDAGSVSGRFLRSGGVTPIPNAQVKLTAGARELYALTGSDGRFTFDGILVGSFTLDAYDPMTNRSSRASGSIGAAGQQVVVDLIELPRGIVSGTVRRAGTMVPLAGLRVALARPPHLCARSMRPPASTAGSASRTSRPERSSFRYRKTWEATLTRRSPQPRGR